MPLEGFEQRRATPCFTFGWDHSGSCADSQFKRGEDRETSVEAVIQPRESSGLDQGGSRAGGEKWLDCGDVFKAEMTGLADGLEGGVREKQKSRMFSTFLT